MDTCRWTDEQIHSSIQEQLRRARSVFNLRIGVDMLQDHFVNGARAFAQHPSRRTTRIDLVFETNTWQYRPYDVRRAAVNEDPNLFPMAPPSLIFIESDP